MLRKKTWLGFRSVGAVVSALFVGMLAVGCGADGNPSSGGKMEAGLNGTWVNEKTVLVLSNGTFEMSGVFSDAEENPIIVKFQKGNVSTSGKTITFTPKNMHGDYFIHIGINSNLINFVSKWYTEKEMKEVFGGDYLSIISGWFGKRSDTYALSENNLTIGDGTPYTKR